LYTQTTGVPVNENSAAGTVLPTREDANEAPVCFDY